MRTYFESQGRRTSTRSAKFAAGANRLLMALVSSYEGFMLDYGGVMVHHQSDSDQAKLARIADIPKDLFTELYWSERSDYDKDVISGIEYWQTIAQRGERSSLHGLLRN